MTTQTPLAPGGPAAAGAGPAAPARRGWDTGALGTLAVILAHHHGIVGELSPDGGISACRTW